MLTTLSQAKTLVQNKIQEIEGIVLEEIEKDILDTLVEDVFSSKIEDLIDEQEIEDQNFESEEALDAYLFHKIPSYTALLEETTVEVINEYITSEEEAE